MASAGQYPGLSPRRTASSILRASLGETPREGATESLFNGNWFSAATMDRTLAFRLTSARKPSRKNKGLTMLLVSTLPANFFFFLFDISSIFSDLIISLMDGLSCFPFFFKEKERERKGEVAPREVAGESADRMRENYVTKDR